MRTCASNFCCAIGMGILALSLLFVTHSANAEELTNQSEVDSALKQLKSATQAAKDSIPRSPVLKKLEDDLDKAARKNDDTPDKSALKKRKAQKAERDAQAKADSFRDRTTADQAERADNYRDALRKRREARRELKAALRRIGRELAKARQQGWTGSVSFLRGWITKLRRAINQSEPVITASTQVSALPKQSDQLSIAGDPTSTNVTTGQLSGGFLLGNSLLFELGIDVKFVVTDSSLITVFDRNFGATDTANQGFSDTFPGFGGDARINVPLAPRMRAFTMAWTMAGDTEEVIPRIVYAPGDNVNVQVSYTPNILTLGGGVERDFASGNFFGNTWSMISAAVYLAARWGKVEHTHTAEGPAGSVKTVTQTDTVVSPVIGAEITMRTFFQNSPIYLLMRGGLQITGGDEVTSTVNTAGATSTVNIDTGTSVHGYAMVGFGVPVTSFQSDRRLKREIGYLATLDNGIRLYSFRYLWDNTVRVGVMAQDLLAHETYRHAVITTANGFYAVDYYMLGLRPATLQQWNENGLAAVMLKRTPRKVSSLVPVARHKSRSGFRLVTSPE